MDISLNKIQWNYLSPEGTKWLSEKKTSQIDSTLVKPSINRSVYYLPEGLFVKIFCYSGIRGMIKRFSGGKACKEGAIAIELDKRGISVPHVLGYGSINKTGRVVKDLLITKEVVNSMRLIEFHQKIFPHLAFKEKQTHILRLAQFIKKIHMSGVFHGDLNFGNILVQRTNGTHQFVLLDLDKVRLTKGHHPIKNRIENFGVLLQMFWPSTSLTQKFRFLKSYGMDWWQNDKISLINSIRNHTLKLNYKRGRTRSRHCVSTHAHFSVKRSKRFNTFIYRNPDSDRLIQYLLPNPNRFFQNTGLFNSQIIPQEVILSIEDKQYELIGFTYHGVLNIILNSIKRSPGLQTWVTRFGFLLRKISVPQPLMCVEEKKKNLTNRTFILSEHSEKALSAHAYWHHLSMIEKKRLLVRMAIDIGRMHQTGCLHGDLSWHNILIDPAKHQRNVLFTKVYNGYIRRDLQLQEAIRDLRPFMNNMKELHGNKDDWLMFVRVWGKHSNYTINIDSPPVSTLFS